MKLVEDDTPEVQDAVFGRLSEYGTDLEIDLEELKGELTPGIIARVSDILEKNRKTWIIKEWNKVFKFRDEYEKLEHYLNLIENYIHGLSSINKTAIVLDNLANEFAETGGEGPFDLSDFLFVRKGISGTKTDYYDPSNSSIFSAVKEKKGLPITLAIIFLLVGKRFNYQIEGCNFPGHFLAKVNVGGRYYYFDCFNGGKIMFEKDLLILADPDSKYSILKLLQMKTDARVIIRRVLNNLVNAFNISKREDQAKVIKELLIKDVKSPPPDA